MGWTSSPGFCFRGRAMLIFIGPTGEFHAKLSPAEARSSERSTFSLPP